MSLLPLIPADYPYVVAVGTLGIYGLLSFQSITVSKARKLAQVDYPAPYADNADAKRDIKAKRFSESSVPSASLRQLADLVPGG